MDMGNPWTEVGHRDFNLLKMRGKMKPVEVRAGIEPTFADLQSAASPLCHRTGLQATVYRVRRAFRSIAAVRSSEADLGVKPKQWIGARGAAPL